MSLGSPSTTPPTQDSRSLAYTPVADAWDEMLAAPGEPRPHWAPFVRWLDGLAPPEMARRWEQARRLIHENGVTYNVYGDPRGMHRPWELDALPLLIAPAEWVGVERALVQRAQLLNLILADLYGPQRLLRERHLPAELVWAHPGFLRPCHGIRHPRDVLLHLYAADLARAPDGGLWVMADRTQAPSGAGYALENRLVLSRTLAEVFRDCHVQRLASFFATLRATLGSLALHHRDNPRVVLLTPGPYNETYFEHAYLARYLGFTLVEGGDLTVRDDAVYLKTLGGLEPVDVILRRLDDAFCDPLSLRADSSLGVAGLVHAVRAGNVMVANALGSGLIETSALMAFLPGLCRLLLGEELEMPSVATWWCGQDDAMAYVTEHLERLVIKPAFPASGLEPVFGHALDAAERDALLRRLRARPHEYVAQEQVALGTAPVWLDERVEPRHLVLRSFLVASDDGYRAMPGGLTRVATSRDSLVVSMQRGGGSKDTWVLSDRPVSPVTLLRPPGPPIELRRGGSEVPSRVADNLFWLGRQVELAESTARLLRTVAARLADEASGSEVVELPVLLAVLAAHVGLEGGPPELPAGADHAARRRVVHRSLRDESAPRALRATIVAAQRLASISRDQISLDTWRVLKQLDAHLRPRGATAPMLGETLDSLSQIVLSLAAFSGLGMENMTRGQGWRFADMGRRIERALFLVTLLRGTLIRSRDDETPVLEALLEIADCAITYRRRYLGAVQVAAVLDLLLTDETNPRSVVFQVQALAEHVERLPRAGGEGRRTPEERIAIGMLTRLRLVEPETLDEADAAGMRGRLAALLDDIAAEVPALSDAVTQSYLSHAVGPQPLSTVVTGGAT
jgi:uncharacterized circularly permuted ATP-grasp superfamily protein/uncharacterized alpha-E superfamily protein